MNNVLAALTAMVEAAVKFCDENKPEAMYFFSIDLQLRGIQQMLSEGAPLERICLDFNHVLFLIQTERMVMDRKFAARMRDFLAVTWLLASAEREKPGKMQNLWIVLAGKLCDSKHQWAALAASANKSPDDWKRAYDLPYLICLLLPIATSDYKPAEQTPTSAAEVLAS